MNQGVAMRPSWWYSLLAIPGVLIGIGLFVFFLWSGIKSTTATLTQVVVPGEADLSLTTPSVYTIFLEQPSVVNGKRYASSESAAALTCKVTAQRASQASEESTKTEVPLHRPSVNTNYSLGNRAGRAVLEFQANEEASYHLSCYYPEGSTGPETVLAVGTGVASRIFGTLMRSFLGFLVGAGLAAAVIITIFIKRERVRRVMLLEMNRANQARLAGGSPQPPQF